MAGLKCSYCKESAVYTAGNMGTREGFERRYELFPNMITAICLCEEHKELYSKTFDMIGLTLLRRR